MTYEEVKTAAAELSPAEQDKLLAVLTAEHTKRKAKEKAEQNTGWKRKAWAAVATAAAAAALLLGGMTATGCTYNSTQSTTADGATQSTTAFAVQPGDLFPHLLTNAAK